MSTRESELPNSPAAIRQRMLTGRISWFGPALMLFARFILALLAQALVASIYRRGGHPEPWVAAAPWWTVYGTLIDLGCLLLLTHSTHQEGIRLFDLIGFQRQQMGRHLLLGFGFTLVLFLVALVGGALVTWLSYGSTPPPVLMGGVPAWAALYSLIIWPVIWGITEEMTYQGYSLPRLEALTGSAWVALFLVSLGWGLQHVVLPLKFDWHFMLWRFAASLPVGIVAVLLYLRIRHLTPLILAHWATNFFSIVTLVILPMVAR